MTIQPQPSSTHHRDTYPCRWDWCREILHSEAEFKSHLIESHVRTAKPILTSELRVWKGTDGGWYGVDKGFETLMGHPNPGDSSSLSFTLDQASDINETHIPQPQPGPSAGTPLGTSSQPLHTHQESRTDGVLTDGSQSVIQTESERIDGSGPLVHGAGQSEEPSLSSGKASDNTKSGQSDLNSAVQASSGSLDSRPRTQVVPMDIDPDTTTLESWLNHPDDQPTSRDIGNDTVDTEMETMAAAASEVKILSQQSGTSSNTIPDTYDHEDGPTILPPLENERSSEVASSPPRSAMGYLQQDGSQYSSFTSPVRLSVPVSNMRESVETPDKPLQSMTRTKLSDQTRTPVHTRFEFGSVVHTSPSGEQVVGATTTGDQGKEQNAHTEGDSGVGKDVSARKGPVGVGFAFGRTS